MASPSFHAQVSGRRDELVVLVHGFGRTARDMNTLKTYLELSGYDTFSPTLPTFIMRVSGCADILARKLTDKDSVYSRLHFVGHSMGGLIIRYMLSEKQFRSLGRCVFIGTPNGGTPLAGMVKKYLPPIAWMFRPYYDLDKGIEINRPCNNPAPDMGAIAGNRRNIIFGSLIRETSDGRVPLDSIPFSGMTDMIVLPYHHEEIHHKKDTAQYIINFLATGLFN